MRKIFCFLILGIMLVMSACSTSSKVIPTEAPVPKRTFTPVDQQTVTLADVFCEGAVLQRGKNVNIFGTGINEEAKITVTVGNNTAETYVKDGRWCAVLSPMEASTEPLTLSVSSNDSTQTINVEDISVGEVWFFAGQSNMNIILAGVSTAEMNKYTNDDLRQFRMTMPDAKFANPENEVGQEKWLKANRKYEKSAYSYASAVAHFSSKNVADELAVPTGAVVLACGNTLVSHFIDGDFYEHMKNNIIPYTFGGVVWYQGESNATAGGTAYSNYEADLVKMIKKWRTDFDADLPFIIVQLPLFPTKPISWGTKEQWEFIKTAQSNVADTLENTYLIKTDDIDKDTDLHPLKQKITVGDRCAQVMLSLIRGEQ